MNLLKAYPAYSTGSIRSSGPEGRDWAARETSESISDGVCERVCT